MASAVGTSLRIIFAVCRSINKPIQSGHWPNNALGRVAQANDLTCRGSIEVRSMETGWEARPTKENWAAVAQRRRQVILGFWPAPIDKPRHIVYNTSAIVRSGFSAAKPVRCVRPPGQEIRMQTIPLLVPW